MPKATENFFQVNSLKYGSIIMKKKSRKGFSLVELLIAVAMTAVLISAVAAGLNAAIISYNENDKASSTMQAARSILSRLSDEIRAADTVDATASTVSIIPAQNDQGLTLLEYSLQNGALVLGRTIHGVLTTQTLLDGTGDVQLAGFGISSVAGQDSEGLACTKSVTARLSLRIGMRTLDMTASASPRRNRDLSQY